MKKDADVIKQRNSTIELLRVLCILMIVFMHLVGIWWDFCDNLFDKEFYYFRQFFMQLCGNNFYVDIRLLWNSF